MMITDEQLLSSSTVRAVLNRMDDRGLHKTAGAVALGVEEVTPPAAVRVIGTKIAYHHLRHRRIVSGLASLESLSTKEANFLTNLMNRSRRAVPAAAAPAAAAAHAAPGSVTHLITPGGGMPTAVHLGSPTADVAGAIPIPAYAREFHPQELPMRAPPAAAAPAGNPAIRRKAHSAMAMDPVPVSPEDALRAGIKAAPKEDWRRAATYAEPRGFSRGLPTPDEIAAFQQRTKRAFSLEALRELAHTNPRMLAGAMGTAGGAAFGAATADPGNRLQGALLGGVAGGAGGALAGPAMGRGGQALAGHLVRGEHLPKSVDALDALHHANAAGVGAAGIGAGVLGGGAAGLANQKTAFEMPPGMVRGVLQNAAVGGALGAGTGAFGAGEGHRMEGALRGGAAGTALGAVVGGVGTHMMNRAALASGMTPEALAAARSGPQIEGVTAIGAHLGEEERMRQQAGALMGSAATLGGSYMAGRTAREPAKTAGLSEEARKAFFATALPMTATGIGLGALNAEVAPEGLKGEAFMTPARNVILGALPGATAGLAAGSMLGERIGGPRIGAPIGAALGVTAGSIGGVLGAKKLFDKVMPMSPEYQDWLTQSPNAVH